jgi:serine/threonine-protein kinase
MAATQIAGQPRGGYRDDYRTTGGYDRYQDTGYQEADYEQTARYQGGGYERGYEDSRARGGYDRSTGYTDESDRYGGTGEHDEYRDGYGAGGERPPPPKRSNAWKWVLAALAVVLTFVIVSLVATTVLSTGNSGSSNKPITIPQVVGQPKDVARNRLTQAGLNPNNFAYVQETVNDQSKVDSVLKIDPAEGTSVNANAKITLTIGARPNSVIVPSVVGESTSDATQTLSGKGFHVTVRTYTGTTSQPAGTVAQTDPAAGQSANLGDTVTIYVVSSQITVPDETGKSVGAAKADLQQLGLTPQIQQQPSSQQPGTVVSQSPPVGATASRGETVTLYVASATTSTPSASATATATATPTDTATATATPTHGGGGKGNASATPSP